MDQKRFNDALRSAGIFAEQADGAPGEVTWQGTTESGELQLGKVEGETDTVLVVADTNPDSAVAVCTSGPGGIGVFDLAKLRAPTDKLALRGSEQPITDDDVKSIRLGEGPGTLTPRVLARGEEFIPFRNENGICYLGNLVVKEQSKESQP
ncbi:MAG TPA: hypothetical protein VFB59_04715 [Candidatus Saccharimonadales bacterium]|nr:hypothetical protein [Candidatus Saccharimonadales bacterium]